MTGMKTNFTLHVLKEHSDLWSQMLCWYRTWLKCYRNQRRQMKRYNSNRTDSLLCMLWGRKWLCWWFGCSTKWIPSEAWWKLSLAQNLKDIKPEWKLWEEFNNGATFFHFSFQSGSFCYCPAPSGWLLQGSRQRELKSTSVQAALL